VTIGAGAYVKSGGGAGAYKIGTGAGIYIGSQLLTNPSGFAVTAGVSNADKATAWTNSLNDATSGLFGGTRAFASGYLTSQGKMGYNPGFPPYTPPSWFGDNLTVGLIRFAIPAALQGVNISVVKVDLTVGNLYTGQNAAICIRTNSASTVNSPSSETATSVWTGNSSGNIDISWSATLDAYLFICVTFDTWPEPTGSGNAYKYTAIIDSSTVKVAL